jgi:prolyl-tRNA synthetase
MKQSKYFLKTSKTFSTDDEKIISSKFLKQAGFIRESVAGRYFILPIGQKVQQKIIRIVKEEMDSTGAQEMVSPILHPLELWKETNRTNTAGFELMKVKDRRESEFALGGTAEEMFVDLVRKFEISYKDLPFQIYQFSPKFRDELRARGGLLRVREFIMKDGYSFHKDEEDFKKNYEEMKVVYTNIFQRLGLKTDIVESDNGYIGGEYCHEFIVESEIGESRYFISEDGKYAAHEDVAKFEVGKMNLGEEEKQMQEVLAERGNTMEDGVKFHNLPLWRQIKDVMFVDEKGRFILAVIRGDLEVNETKLKHLVKANSLRHATGEEIREILNSEPGFISPVKIKDKIASLTNFLIVADDSMRTVKNFYGGANKKHFDLLNVNIDRDFKADIEGDIALAEAGFESLGGHGKFLEKRGIEVGNIFQLGYHYTKLMKGAEFTDTDGTRKPYYMGCYGIGIGRTLAAIVEKTHDEKGIIWPESVAPFKVHLIAIRGAEEKAGEIYQTLLKSGIEVLYDDRDQSPGVKFADADLIGIFNRVVVSPKTLEKESVEVKKRNQEKAELVKIDSLLEVLK